MLSWMIVEIQCQERDNIRNRLYFILRMSYNIGLIKIQMTQVKIKEILIAIQGFYLVLLILED